jgi:diadenosine tetraphosphate (Ap4A) HIT family hydrolase
MKNRDYSIFRIKEFNRWELYLHENQCYLGRTFLLAKDITALDFAEMSIGERNDFFAIATELKEILGELFSPDKFNYAALGNVFKRLHVHIIPRYKTPRVFEGITFIDHQWGKNYAPYDKSFLINSDVQENIISCIRRKLI